MKKLKRQLITDVQSLDMNSKIEFFNYMVSYNIAFMENTNGVFFSIADISDDILDKLIEKLVMLQKFQLNKKNSDELLLRNDFESMNSNKLVDIEQKKENETQITINNSKKEVFSKAVINEYSEILKDMENRTNKMNKKHSIYIKYSIAKKKYNKQLGSQDNKKIENFYLNELEEENYIF